MIYFTSETHMSLETAALYSSLHFLLGFLVGSSTWLLTWITFRRLGLLVQPTLQYLWFLPLLASAFSHVLEDYYLNKF